MLMILIDILFPFIRNFSLTDHRIMGQGQQKWLSILMGYDFEIKYKPGKENGVTDALSRKREFLAITTVHCEVWDGLEEEVLADERLKTVL